jgi:hypothetical protein
LFDERRMKKQTSLLPSERELKTVPELLIDYPF